MEEKKINKSIVFSIVAILLLVIVVAGATYAYFRAVGQTEEQEVTTANLTMGFAAGEWINTEGLMPISDAQIKTGGAAELPFTVTNTGDEHMNITITLSDITITDGLKDVDFRWGLFNTTTGNGLAYGIFSDLGDATELMLYTNTIIDATDSETKNSKNYTLRIWIHDNGAAQDSLMGQSLKAKVKVTGEAVEYTPEECFTSFNKETGELYGTYELIYNEDLGMDEDVVGSFAYDTTNPNCPKDVVIPKTIDGVAVTSIGEWAFGGLESVYGYSDSIGMNSIIIPEGVTSVNPNGIAENPIEILTIPEGVTDFSGPYIYNPNLKNMYISDTVENMSFGYAQNFNINSLVIPLGVTEIGELAFYGCSTQNIILHENVTSIGKTAFYQNGINSIEIPASVGSVGDNAFFANNNLTKVVVRGKDSLDDFDDATGLTTEGGLKSGVTIEFRP